MPKKKKKKKLKIGWFCFTCCEDSSIVFTELLNDHFFEWKKVIDFQHVRILKTDNKLEGLDVAFVEGAISSYSQATELLEIRKNCKKLIAVGSCAVTGQPSGARNSFSDELHKKLEEVYETFKYSDKVQRLDELVQVDDKLPGCPMSGNMFIEKLEGLLEEFNIKTD